MYSVNANRTPQNILDNTLSEVIKQPVFDRLNSSISDIVVLNSRAMTVYLLSEKMFNKFCLFATRSEFKDAKRGYKERCIMFNLLYTDHEDFNFSDIPVYKNEKLETVCKYDPAKVYSIRIVSEERLNDKKTYTEDIIMYIPSDYLNLVS